MIRYVLFKSHQNSGCPIKRDELTQLVTKNYPNRSLPAFVLNKAFNKLSTIFGYDVKELQRVRPSSTNQARASQSERLLLMNLFFIDNSICMNSVNVNGLLVTFGLFDNYLK